MKKPLILRGLFGLILVTSVYYGCDNSLDLIDEATGSYSIYGALDMNKEINFIRVKDLNVPIENIMDEPLNVEVVLENLTEGVSQVLKDSVVIFDGVPTHNFYTTMDIPPRSEFRITVSGEDGRTTTARATAPNLSDVYIEPEKPGCRTEVDVEVSPIEAGNVSSEIAVSYDGMEWRWGGFEQEFDDKVVHTFQPQEILDEIWKDWAIASFDCGVLCYEDPRPQCYELDSDFWKVKFIHYGPDVDEGDLSNDIKIPGGVGKFRIVRVHEVSFQIDSSRVIPPRELPFYCQNKCPPME